MSGLTDKQIAARRGRFTASSFAGLLGLSPWGPPSYWWALQMGKPGAVQSIPMVMGNIYEDAIVEAARYKLTQGFIAKSQAAAHYGRFEKPDSVYHAEHREWLVCHPDGLFYDAKEMIQAKRHDSHLSGRYSRAAKIESDNDFVPVYELIQCQIELACWRSQREDRFKWVVNWLAVELGNADGPLMCRITWDKELAGLLLEKGKWFWHEHMRPGHEQKPDDTAWDAWMKSESGKDLYLDRPAGRVKLSAEDLLRAPVQRIGGGQHGH